LDEIALEMECFDNTVDIPQKPATESKEPVKLKKVVTKKKSITPKKPVSDGIKQRKSTVMLKQRSPLKMVPYVASFSGLFLFCFSSYVASFSGLSIFDSILGFL
jgi:hypothetical protein